jgi:predicted MPP superfamily phosphohydrolase
MIRFQQTVFLVVVFVATYLLYVYPLYALNALIFQGGVFQLSSFILALVFAAAIVFYFRSHNTSPPLKFFVYHGMGIGFIAVWVVTLGLMARAILPGMSLIIGLVCIAGIIVLSLSAMVKGRLVKTKHLDVTSSKVSGPIRLVFISDVHLGSNPRSHLEKILAKATALEFDLLLIGGDLIDASSFDLADLSPLKGIKQPVLFVSGNHEYYVKGYETLLEGLGDYGPVFLDNEAYTFRDINIVGISDNQSLNGQKAAAGKLLVPEMFNLALVHKPSLWDHIYEGSDLMLSGHTHNGQMIPFNLLVRRQFNQVYGLYEQMGSRLYVSSGAACWGPRMRLGTQNEIVHITISAD